MSREADDDKLWNWIRRIYPAEDHVYEWVAVISPSRAEERTDWRLIRQRAVRIVRSVGTEAIVESEDGVRVRMPLVWVRARCVCEWSMLLNGCRCGAMKRDTDVAQLLDLHLPED